MELEKLHDCYLIILFKLKIASDSGTITKTMHSQTRLVTVNAQEYLDRSIKLTFQDLNILMNTDATCTVYTPSTSQEPLH